MSQREPRPPRYNEQKTHTSTPAEGPQAAAARYAERRPNRDAFHDGRLGAWVAMAAAVQECVRQGIEPPRGRARPAEYEPLPAWARRALADVCQVHVSLPDHARVPLEEEFPILAEPLSVEQLLRDPPFPLDRALMEAREAALIALRTSNAEPFERARTDIQQVLEGLKTAGVDDFTSTGNLTAFLLAGGHRISNPTRPRSRPKGIVWRAFYEGVRATFAQEGLGTPTAEDVADLSQAWGVESGTRRGVRKLWVDRLLKSSAESGSLIE